MEEALIKYGIEGIFIAYLIFSLNEEKKRNRYLEGRLLVLLESAIVAISQNELIARFGTRLDKLNEERK